MTQTGKCSTCRQRKVKCDEEKPKCGACKKKNRPCSYDYGKPLAFVVEDPNQLTKHGKSKTAPLVYALDGNNENNDSSDLLSSDMRVTAERAADSGSGVFQTLTPVSVSKVRSSKKAEAYQRKRLHAYLQRLQFGSLNTHKPWSPETSLITRYIDMVGSGPVGYKPLSILGTWVESIPSRMGYNRTLDLAIEFLLDSYSVFWDDIYSKRRLAESTKAKALAELQLAVVKTPGTPSYDVVLATKTHYAAEALLRMDTMYHAIHAFGLAEILKTGVVAGVDDEHFWSLIDNTYIDDVHEAMIAGRKSVYDNDYYLATTFPPAISTDPTLVSPTQRASLAIMHVFVQCPRLISLIRSAVLIPEATSSLASAVSLMEYLWQVDLTGYVNGLIKDSVTITNQPVSPQMADIMPETYHYNSIQSMILCTRYWMLLNVFCGIIDTLHRRFPAEVALSLLPDLETIRGIDMDAGLHLAKSLGWAESGSQTLPLVPLRLHTPLQISIGPWRRLIRNSNEFLAANPDLDAQTKHKISQEVNRAIRMKEWLVEQCNRIHERWDVSAVNEQSLIEALDAMTGEKIPDWLPTKIRFEAEDGDMVMKLEYERQDGPRQEHFKLGTSISPPSQFSSSSQTQDSPVVYELPDRTGSGSTPESTLTAVETPETSLDAENATPLTDVDLIFKSGRNLCQISGWWPTTPDADATAIDTPGPGPCLASSWWPQTPESSAGLRESISMPLASKVMQSSKGSARGGSAFSNGNVNACMSPAWKSPDTSDKSTSFDNRRVNACMSPAWTSHVNDSTAAAENEDDMFYSSVWSGNS